MRYIAKVVPCIAILFLLGLSLKMNQRIAELKQHKVELEHELSYVKGQLLTMDHLRLTGLVENRDLSFRLGDIESAHKRLLSRLTKTLSVTAYSASADDLEDVPPLAASMKPARPGTVAVSRDLFDQGWDFGKKVHIEGLGTYVINDLMDQTMKKRIDVFIDDKSKAKKFGLKQKKITLLGD